jgi:hypothetical protein
VLQNVQLIARSLRLHDLGRRSATVLPGISLVGIGRRGDVLIAQAVGRAAIKDHKPDTINDDLIDAGRITFRIEILPTR